ncbi:MAG: paraquat-inducible protein A [Marinobacter sp.]|uniref:paraquat-inducible protein A n=1 Tax=Marinobacter sp. TaxID=50741 RepID=UPI00299E6BEE|nr:paraquat-inducible protein A [Marinobacter sp.]MDX1757495.1 paraquat-inducible protein A [Marinobacter sp.]
MSASRPDSNDRPGLLLACPECDLVSEIVPHQQEGRWHLCPRCHHALLRQARSDQLTPALAVTALILLLLSLLFPYIAFERGGIERAMTVADAANELAMHHHPLLSVVVVATIVVIPALYLLAVCIIHLSLASQARLPGSLWLARWLPRLQPWMMADVFAIAALVSLVKIIAMAHIQLLSAFWTFTGYAVLLLVTVTRMNTIALWQRLLGPLDQPARARAGLMAVEQGLVGCSWCGQLQQRGHQHCLRCRSRLRQRHPFTLQRVWALLVTAMLCSLPAHLYPIMVTTSLGQSDPATIIGGVLLFIDHGDWPIALIIFAASVLIPFGKIIAIAWLCIASRRRRSLDMAGQMRLYRITEWVGRWSMIDVFVVAIIVGLFQLGNILTITPGYGGLAFSAVVIFTMLAAHQFDPRLIWDQQRRVAAGRLDAPLAEGYR